MLNKKMNKKTDGDKIQFLSIYTKCLEVKNNVITQREFEDWLDMYLYIKKYLPISTKKALIDLFFFLNSNVEVDKEDFISLSFIFEIYSVFGFLFEYTNIEISSDEYSAENYDIIAESGIIEYIQNICFNDYARLCNMAMNTINFRNAYIVDTFTKDIDFGDIEKIEQSINKTFKDVSYEKMQLVKDIINTNDPSLGKIKDIIYDNNLDIIGKEKEE